MMRITVNTSFLFLSVCATKIIHLGVPFVHTAQTEEEFLRQMVKENAKQKLMCQRLGVCERTLRERLKRYGLQKPTHAEACMAWIGLIKDMARNTLYTRAELLHVVVSEKLHPKELTMSVFEKLLRAHGVRFRDKLNDDQVYQLCAMALRELDRNHGIRALQVHIKHAYELRINLNRIMETLRELDPVGVLMRCHGT